MIFHEVKRGESLWSLAHVHLGSGTRWPEIYTEHNKAAEKSSPFQPLMPILNENLIFVGQKIVLPPRKKNPAPGTGAKAAAQKPSLPADLKVSYTIGRDTPPIEHIWPLADLTVKTGLTGTIALEITSDHKRRHAIELAMSKNPAQAKQILKNVYDPAICALTGKPVMMFDFASRQIKIKAPISTSASVGPLEFKVTADAPNHFAGSISPPTLNGTIKVNGTNFKFSADISLSGDVTWHPKPGGRQPEPVRVTEPVKIVNPVEKPTNSIDWKQAAESVNQFAAVVSLMIISLIPQVRMALSGTTTSMMPFTHTINPRGYDYPNA